MASEPELDEFSALSLILQHRALSTGLQAVEGALEFGQSSRMTDGEARVHLLPTLRSFTQNLPTHFAAEARALAALLRNGADLRLVQELQRLDGEHPRLLARFQASLAQLADYETRSGERPWPLAFEHAIAELMVAIGAFRRHEAEEDALFAD